MITCNQCVHLFITHDARRRWGCRKFGFKSSKIPYQEVMATTGMKCAYYKQRSFEKKLNLTGGHGNEFRSKYNRRKY